MAEREPRVEKEPIPVVAICEGHGVIARGEDEVVRDQVDQHREKFGCYFSIRLGFEIKDGKTTKST